MDRWIWALLAVMKALCPFTLGKKELSRKAKFLIYWSIYVPIFNYGHAAPWNRDELAEVVWLSLKVCH